ncbi:MAG: Stp1/IreP family PP2C-type Ser/Thr phosphatase [Anaerolineae bacterium]|nr:Stp1/IreP family PP2C-type Ser/Thr phosphatase [Anaerolineae bacterium]
MATPLTGQSPLQVTSPIPTPSEGGGPSVWMPFVGRQPGQEGEGGSPWTLVGLAAAAGLLFVATAAGVFVLIRGFPKRRAAQRSAPRQTLPAVSDGAPFSEGTMLNEGRYLVLSAQTDDAGAHSYEVKPTLPVDLCPYCFHQVGEDAGHTCVSCGRPLPEHRPEHPVLVAREVQDPACFVALADLVKRPPHHAALVTPVSVFVETSFGPNRSFVVLPDVRDRLSDLPAKHLPLDRVLSWGTALAKGLEALHERSIVFTDIDPAQVQVDAGEARWLCFDRVVKLDGPATDTAREQITANVRDLAALLATTAAPDGDPPPGAGAETMSMTAIQAATHLADPAGRVLAQVLRSRGRLHAGDVSVALARAREALLRDRKVIYEIGAHTDVGRVRKLNEDSMLALDLSTKEDGQSAAVSLVVVADGVGGHAAGDVASQLTVASLRHEADALRADLAAGQAVDAQAWITQAALAANAAVLNERQAMGSDMGSTLVMALMSGAHATVLNVGDSRAYWLRPSGIQQITKDHSLVQRLIDIGQLTPEEARHHPQKSVIYRVMGDNLQLGYDLFEFDLEPGDAILLCSDGLSDLVEDRVVWQVWRDAPALQDACEHLVDLANEGGGYDNITVVILQTQD